MVDAPIPNQKLAASWGASVAENVNANAVSGAGVMRFPGGTATVPGQPPPFRDARIPTPWTVVPCMNAAGDWDIRIYGGRCCWQGSGALTAVGKAGKAGDHVEIPASDAGDDAFDGVPSYLMPANAWFAAPDDTYLHVSVDYDAAGGGPRWGFSRSPDALAVTDGDYIVSRAIAVIRLDENGAPIVRQLPAPGVIIFGGTSPMLFDLRLNADGDQEVYIPSALRGSAVRFNDKNCYNANTGLTSDDWQQMDGTVSVSVKWNNSNNRYEWVFGTVTGAVVTVTIGTASNPLRHGAVNISMFGTDGSSLEPYHVGTTVNKPHVFQLMDFYEGTTARPDSYDIVIRDNGGPNVDYITPADLAADLRSDIIDNSVVADLDETGYWQPHVNRSGVAGIFYVGDPANPNAWTDLAYAISSVISDNTPIDLKTWMAQIEARLSALEGN